MSKGVFVTNEQVRLTGSPNVARFLAQCLYWSTECDLVIQRQGWFYKSRDEWQAETWLSRYQQEKARKQLRDMGLLKESRERRNTGIRLWFWLDQALLNTLLNSLADQSINTDTENNSVELYDSSLTKQSDNCLTGQLDSCKEIEESNSIEEYKTIVLKTPLNEFVNGENSTMVLIKNNNKTSNNSDYDCNEVESIEEAESDKQEADASSLSELTNRSDNIDNNAGQVYVTRCFDLVKSICDEYTGSDNKVVAKIAYDFYHYHIQNVTKGTVKEWDKSIRDHINERLHFIKVGPSLNKSDTINKRVIKFDREDDLIPMFDRKDVGSALESISSKSDTVQYCEDLEAYKACHPFIYQFLKTRLFTGYEWSEFSLDLFRHEGLTNTVLQEALMAFINKHGHSILNWYQANTPIPVQPLNKDDLELAVLISEGALS